MNDEFTPAGFWRGFGTWIGVGLFLALVTAGIVLGGWSAGWWFSNQNATRQFQQTQNGTSNQDSLRAQVTSDFQLLAQEDRQAIADKGNASLVGQDKVESAATALKLCQAGTQLSTAVPLPADQAAWFGVNCQDGAISTSSKYFILGTP